MWQMQQLIFISVLQQQHRELIWNELPFHVNYRFFCALFNYTGLYHEWHLKTCRDVFRGFKADLVQPATSTLRDDDKWSARVAPHACQRESTVNVFPVQRCNAYYVFTCCWEIYSKLEMRCLEMVPNTIQTGIPSLLSLLVWKLLRTRRTRWWQQTSGWSKYVVTSDKKKKKKHTQIHATP